MAITLFEGSFAITPIPPIWASEGARFRVSYRMEAESDYSLTVAYTDTREEAEQVVMDLDSVWLVIMIEKRAVAAVADRSGICGVCHRTHTALHRPRHKWKPLDKPAQMATLEAETLRRSIPTLYLEETLSPQQKVFKVE